MENAKDIFMKEYRECCIRLNLEISKLEKNIESEKERLGICGLLEKSICEYIEKSFSQFQDNVVNIMDKIEKEFKKPLSSKFIKVFEIENNNVINSYSNRIYEILRKSNMKMSESSLNRLRILYEETSINIKKRILERNDSIKRIIKLEKKPVIVRFFIWIRNTISEKILKILIMFLLSFFITVASIYNYTKVIRLFETIRNLL